MTGVGSAGAAPAFQATQTGNTLLPRSLHYTRPSAPSGPATSGAASAFEVSTSARHQEATAPRRVDITV